MTKHAFAWESLVFGVFFLAVAGGWVAQRQDTFTLGELGVTAPIILIALGIIGIATTIWRKK